MPSLVPRDSYAALERCTYLNQAALGLVPIPAVEAMHAFLERTAQHGNLYLSDEQEAEILDGVRSAGAELLGTTPDAVAVVGSASEGLGQIASLLEADRGTVVLVSTDFPSVTYPWLAAAQRREIELRFVEDRADRDLTRRSRGRDRSDDVRGGVRRRSVRDRLSDRRRSGGRASSRRRRSCGGGRDAARRGRPCRHDPLGRGRRGHERLQVAVEPRRRGTARGRSRPLRASPSDRRLEGNRRTPSRSTLEGSDWPTTHDASSCRRCRTRPWSDSSRPWRSCRRSASIASRDMPPTWRRDSSVGSKDSAGARSGRSVIRELRPTSCRCGTPDTALT